MKRVLVDTNVLISFLTDRDVQQQERAGALFAAAAGGGHEIELPQLVLTEMTFVLRSVYRVEAAPIAAAIRKLLALPGVLPTHALSWPDLLDLWPEQVPAFVDAALVAIAKAGRCDEVATFDRTLAKHLRRQEIALYW